MAARKSKRTASRAPKKKSAKAPAQRRRSSGTGGNATSRPAWSGSLRLALVTVPVKVFPATASGARISFHQVHKPSGKRVRYQKVVPGVGPVDTDEIVKGFEIERDRYVLFEPEEIEDLKLEAKRALNLVQFVAQGEIDPIWFDRPYYVVPDGEQAEEGYNVLRDALRASRKLGLGQFIMRGREYIGALKPCGSGLLLETLRFSDEVREAAPYFADIDEFEPEDELLDLANELIERKTAKFDPSEFHDSYTVALRELIEARRKKASPVEIEEDETPSGGAEIIDLVDALKKSVAGGKSGRRSGGGKRRKAS